MLNLLHQKSIRASDWQAFKSRGYPDTAQWETASESFTFIAELPPLLRTLIVTDGTVTRSLEAYFWEPVAVQPIALSAEISEHEIPWLDTKLGERLLVRQVRLVGKRSCNVYATAYSVVRLDLLPTPMRVQLENGGIGIGVLIRESGLESFRELLDVGTSKSLSFDTVTSSHATQECSDVVYRTYRIYLDKQPAMLVTEKFPKERYQALI